MTKPEDMSSSQMSGSQLQQYKQQATKEKTIYHHQSCRVRGGIIYIFKYLWFASFMSIIFLNKMWWQILFPKTKAKKNLCLFFCFVFCLFNKNKNTYHLKLRGIPLTHDWLRPLLLQERVIHRRLSTQGRKYGLKTGEAELCGPPIEVLI